MDSSSSYQMPGHGAYTITYTTNEIDPGIFLENWIRDWGGGGKLGFPKIEVDQRRLASGKVIQLM